MPLRKCHLGSNAYRLLTWDQEFFFSPVLLFLKREKNNAWYIHSTSRQPHPNLHNLTSALTCHVISQSAFTRRVSNFGGNNVSFEINFREKRISKYVHVQMALPKKIFKLMFFFFVMELPYLYLTATNDKEFTGIIYYYMRNFCNLVGLEQWYFSLIEIPTCENYKPFAGSGI